MSFPLENPMKAQVTLKVADAGDKVIAVTETAEEVTIEVDNAKAVGRMARLHRIKGLSNPPFEFMTQPTNVMNIEESR
jgi:hypothetical protein